MWCGLLAAQSALLLTGPAYYRRYATYLAPALSLVGGGAVGLAANRARAHGLRVVPLLAAGCTGALTLVAVAGQLHPEGARVPRAGIEAAVAHSRCVAADSPSVLAAANLLTRDLRRGCPITFDVTGATYDESPKELPAGPPGPSRRADPAWQRYLSRYLTSADAIIVTQPDADGFTAADQALVASERMLFRQHQLAVYGVATTYRKTPVWPRE